MSPPRTTALFPTSWPSGLLNRVGLLCRISGLVLVFERLGIVLLGFGALHGCLFVVLLLFPLVFNLSFGHGSTGVGRGSVLCHSGGGGGILDGCGGGLRNGWLWILCCGGGLWKTWVVS